MNEFEIKYGVIKVMCLLVQLTTYPTEPPFCQKISQPTSQSVSQSVSHSVIPTHTHCH